MTLTCSAYSQGNANFIDVAAVQTFSFKKRDMAYLLGYRYGDLFVRKHRRKYEVGSRE